MSKRRKAGDRVWVRRDAAFGMSAGEWAMIVDENTKLVPDGFTTPCPYDCGDPDCRQWGNMKCVDRDNEVVFKYVTECEMYDVIPYHKRRRQYICWPG